MRRADNHYAPTQSLGFYPAKTANAEYISRFLNMC